MLERETVNLNEDDAQDFEDLKLNFQDFVDEFKPLPAPDGSGTFLVWPEKTDEVAELDEHLVWTVHWIEDRVAMPGFTPSAINGGEGSSDVSGYIICQKPWDFLDEDDQIVYERQYECAQCEGDGCDACDESGFYWAECYR